MVIRQFLTRLFASLLWSRIRYCLFVAVQAFFEQNAPRPFETSPKWVMFQTGTHILSIEALPTVE